MVLELGREGRGSGKAVVFTESITTQEYLRTLLMRVGLADEEITLFRGSNDHARAKQAHARWVEEVGRHQPPGSRPTREVGRAAGARARVPHAVEGAGLHRGGRQRAEPPVLRDGHQLRPALEPAAHRAADRAVPPLQPGARRHGRQLHRPRQRSAAPDVRDPEPEARSVRQGARRLRHGAARASHRLAGAGRVRGLPRVRERSAEHLQPRADAPTRCPGRSRRCATGSTLGARPTSASTGGPRRSSSRASTRTSGGCSGGSATSCPPAWCSWIATSPTSSTATSRPGRASSHAPRRTADSSSNSTTGSISAWTWGTTGDSRPATCAASRTRSR